MRVEFAKLHGIGNDVVIVDAREQQLDLSGEQIRRFGDRQRGVGFDQLLCLDRAPDDTVDFGLRIFNSDGGRAQQCGNGTRCLGLYIQRLGLSSKNEFLIRSSGRTLKVRAVGPEQFSCDMAVPVFDPQRIPITASASADGRYRLTSDSGDFDVTAVSMGNPHIVMEVPDVANAQVATIGAELVHHDALPEGANVGFMQVLRRDRIALRVYERGVGETLACGTGACAAVAAGQVLGLLDSPVSVALPGGNLTISWGGGTEPLWMSGPAEWSFEGSIYL